MKKTFIEQLNDITRAAQQAITEQMAKQKSVVFFSATEDEDEEWTLDIYDDVPDFPFYDRCGLVNYAAVKEIHLNDQDIKITGILKGDSYPNQVKVLLEELDTYSSASLADFLLSQLPGNREEENQ